jgi:hypothetical protein
LLNITTVIKVDIIKLDMKEGYNKGHCKNLSSFIADHTMRVKNITRAGVDFLILRRNIKIGGDKMTKAEIIDEEDQPGFPEGLIASFLPGSWGKKYECSNCEAELEGDEDTCPECGAELRH